MEEAEMKALVETVYDKGYREGAMDALKTLELKLTQPHWSTQIPAQVWTTLEAVQKAVKEI